MVCNNYHTVEERFCNWLLMMYNCCGNSKLRLTHSQIANYLGVHRPSLTHIAKKLRDRQVIDYCRGKLSILNLRELQNQACECYHEEENIF